MSDLDRAAATLQALAPDYNVAKVQDIVEVDSRHLFVPFISDSGEHGMSFWIWDRFKWELRRIQNHGEPHLWSLRGDDPAGQYLVWNVDPKRKVSGYTFYWIRKRNAGHSYNDDYYIPQVQLEHRITLGELTYGTTALPEQWAELYRVQQKAAGVTGNTGLWAGGSGNPSSYRIGFQPILSGKPDEEFVWSTKADSFGDANVNFLLTLNDSELEGLSPTPGVVP
jgi:hypothetical protein